MRILVFDVNETLLDLSALDTSFGQVFGDRGVRGLWFQQLLLSALTSTVTERYTDFGTLGRTALEMMAERRSVSLTHRDRELILGGMRRLPPHPEVRESLEMLREGGLRLAALTNSTLEVAEAQLRHAGLHDLFEQVLSADTARRLKPHRDAYLGAARSLGAQPGDLRLVAAHAWDVTGAIRAGCMAAFVARPNMVLDPAGERPDIVGADLRQVASRILETETFRG